MSTPHWSTATNSARPAVAFRRVMLGKMADWTLWLARATLHSLYGVMDCSRCGRPGPGGYHFLTFVEPRAGCPGRMGLPEGSRHAWRARRSARAVAPASRGDGGAGQRAGAPGQDRGADRRQYGGGGLLGVRAARGQHARAVR